MPRKTKRKNNKGKGNSSSSSSSSSSSINSTSRARSLVRSGKVKLSSVSDNNSKSDTLGDVISIGGISMIAIIALLISLRGQGVLHHI
jgi:hypothetical protein